MKIMKATADHHPVCLGVNPAYLSETTSQKLLLGSPTGSSFQLASLAWCSARWRQRQSQRCKSCSPRIHAPCVPVIHMMDWSVGSTNRESMWRRLWRTRSHSGVLSQRASETGWSAARVLPQWSRPRVSKWLPNRWRLGPSLQSRSSNLPYT